ncbi:beta-amyrin 28-monooxygenase-like [Papaver somniferum]|uniref:beta-amyrin 28-monooxygenase-like n=1 Tax=Papaver somniferum TaxID=3469 RepID=UPI000E703315|nr:beta-amyrin 28-monooxygenase-like [Papaver somniferum]
MNEVIDNFVALMIASHDSSAAVLTWVIWKLAKDREIYDNVVREEMSIIEERKQRQQQGGGEADGRLTWGVVAKMKYTWRVVQEVMRVIPPFFGSFRTAIKDTSYGGYDIPKGWQKSETDLYPDTLLVVKVFWVAFSTHMNNDIFNDPAEFDPSRFDSKSNIIPPYSYLAFGAGHHICIGLEFARVEALVVLHHMVTKFEWSLVNPDEKLTRLALPYPEMGLPINLIPRSSC